LKRSEFAIPLRYFYPPVGRGSVSVRFQVFPYCHQEVSPPGLFDVRKRLAIDAGCASISSGRTVSLFEGLELRNVHEETPEAM
jgi:hypothetical protein